MTEWRDKAACKDADPRAEGFDESRVDKLSVRGALNAISYCRQCPVTGPCLDEARAKEASGVRGGLLRLDFWARTSHTELTEPQLRGILDGTFKVTEVAPNAWDDASGRSCATCGRRGLKRRPDGRIGRHIDHSHGGFCEGNRENAA